MKAKIGDDEFTMEGEGSDVSEAFKQWLEMIRKRARIPVLQRIAELEAKLAAEKSLLERMDNPPISGGER